MKLADALKRYEVILENGPLGTRLKYDYGIESISNLAKDESIKKALIELYTGDIAVAQESNKPIIINAATFRANRNHLGHGLSNNDEFISSINSNAIQLVNDLKKQYSTESCPIFLGAPIGSMYDAYSTVDFPTSEESKIHHQEQIDIFKQHEVDFINVVTIPSVSEALGIALAAENSGIDYTIGFILNKEGNILDGTELNEAIRLIDSKTKIKPLGYLITCTHGSVLSKLISLNNNWERLIGLQLNGSKLNPSELVSQSKSIADPPPVFTKTIIELKRHLKFNIIGGCCGTSREHLQMLAQKL